jgi:hypothetical protein
MHRCKTYIERYREKKEREREREREGQRERERHLIWSQLKVGLFVGKKFDTICLIIPFLVAGKEDCDIMIARRYLEENPPPR